MSTLIFDCDGVLADTERFGHLPAFNATFAEFGLPVVWSEEAYGEKLAIGGGKERMASVFTDAFVAENGLPPDEPGQRELLAAMHARKTAIYTAMVQGREIEPRPGIARIVGEARAAGWNLAVASTSAPESVQAVLERAVGAEVAAEIPVFAGDVVPAKKPDPAIYVLAVAELGADPAGTIVVEDSRNGLVAATRAGLRCVVTVNEYTAGDDFSEAMLVVTDLGDSGHPTHVIANRSPASPLDLITLSDLQACLGATEEHTP